MLSVEFVAYAYEYPITFPTESEYKILQLYLQETLELKLPKK